MSISATYLQDLRVAFPSNLDRDELRRTRHGLLNAVLTMTEHANSIVSKDLRDKSKISAGRTLSVPVRNYGNVEIKNVRSCDVTCTESESELKNVVFKTAVADICMIPAQYEKNEIGYLDDLNQKITTAVTKFKTAIEMDINIALETFKATEYNSPFIGTKYPLNGGAIIVKKVNQSLFFNDIDSINLSDDFYNEENVVIGSPTLMSFVSNYINQGAGNNTNTAFQFAGKDFSFSNRIPTTGIASGYFMPQGTVGLLTRVDPDSRLKHKAGDGTEWDINTLPGLPFEVGIKYSSKCTDASAILKNGMEHLKASLIEHFQISFDYAIVTPHHKTGGANTRAISKFTFKNGK